MKSGLTIVEMAQQIERQSKLKQDYLLDTRRLQVEPFGSQLYLHTFDDHDDPLVEPLEINQIAHRQIGTHLKIPAAYYDRMLSDYPELLAENVNSWFQREPTQRMVRTLDGTVRAFLSNRYRRIDNLDIAEIVLPVIQQMEDAYFESCQITDSRMYIKVVNKRLEATKRTPEQRTKAMLLIDKAGEIIKQVQDDGSWGVHAFNYTKQRVETAQAYLTKAQSIIDQGGYKAVKATK